MVRLPEIIRDSDDRPDIAVFESGLACNCDLDIAMAHPWRLDVFPQSRMKEGVAAKRREERKEAKYNKLYSSMGEKSSVVPLVFNHFGRWGKRQKHICQVWHQDQEMKQGERMYQTSNVIGDDVQKCNAKVIAKKISKLSRNQDNDTFDSSLAISNIVVSVR